MNEWTMYWWWEAKRNNERKEEKSCHQRGLPSVFCLDSGNKILSNTGNSGSLIGKSFGLSEMGCFFPKEIREWSLLNVVSLPIQALLTMELTKTFLLHIKSKNCKEMIYFLQSFFLCYLSAELLKLECARKSPGELTRMWGLQVMIQWVCTGAWHSALLTAPKWMQRGWSLGHSLSSVCSVYFWEGFPYFPLSSHKALPFHH